MEHGKHDHAEVLDLDAEVLAEHLAAVVTSLPAETEPRHIVDLGCGTGAGTFLLLKHFPEARVTAVDASAVHLGRLAEKAEAAGVADRVHTVRADLDAPWPDLGKPDLVWASAALHHMADPGRVLRQVHEMLAPGGLFAVVELADFPRFLPPDAPEDRPGLEDRCHAAMAHRIAELAPHRGADWGPELVAAGFTVESERTITANLPAKHNEAVGRYALAGLSRVHQGAAQSLPAEDLAALDRLLDTSGPHSLLRRDDLAVRAERTVWTARRRA
ncbi:class I SAM-dependent methyltransferase [Amycolatopsis magusensis]|uniref:class I SAM-dependent methyltransferase n=1 Tax=Amycolatopsis magusensis TaxID=882444 RepID=UPI0024A7E7CE|nr:class I SAM-dependent methyltransferase [Amycolatopsis magusensis]MDI5981163.1 methyltransferase domain-containing protein [Amycolatopsis magusensis]